MSQVPKCAATRDSRISLSILAVVACAVLINVRDVDNMMPAGKKKRGSD